MGPEPAAQTDWHPIDQKPKSDAAIIVYWEYNGSPHMETEFMFLGGKLVDEDYEPVKFQDGSKNIIWSYWPNPK